MPHHFISLMLVAVGAAIAVTAGCGLLSRLLDQEMTPGSKWKWLLLLDWTGITLLKNWNWKSNAALTGIVLLGLGLFLAGLKLL